MDKLDAGTSLKNQQELQTYGKAKFPNQTQHNLFIQIILQNVQKVLAKFLSRSTPRLNIKLELDYFHADAAYISSFDKKAV